MSIRRRMSCFSLGEVRPRDLVLYVVATLNEMDPRGATLKEVCRFLGGDWGASVRSVRQEITAKLKRALQLGFLKKKGHRYRLDDFVSNHSRVGDYPSFPRLERMRLRHRGGDAGLDRWSPRTSFA